MNPRCDPIDRPPHRDAGAGEFLDTIRTGGSRTLVLRGEPGVGKTALDIMERRATDCRVLRAAAAQAEMELAFAGLHQLLTPVLDRAERLPDPRRDALRTAFGMAPGATRFLIAISTLGLLSVAADDGPLLCLADDAHRLDIRIRAPATAWW